MKKILVLAVVLGALTIGASSASADMRSHPSTTIARLQPVDSSGVSGFVALHQLRGGGSIVAVLAFGLDPGTEYGSFYYDDNACMVDPEEVGTFTANMAGVGFVAASIDEDVDEVGSVSVRTPDYSTLFACADTSS
jgi:hypothetical protein